MNYWIEFILIKKRNHASINERGLPEELLGIDEGIVGNWKEIIMSYLQNPFIRVQYFVRQQVLNSLSQMISYTEEAMRAYYCNVYDYRKHWKSLSKCIVLFIEHIKQGRRWAG